VGGALCFCDHHKRGDGIGGLLEHVFFVYNHLNDSFLAIGDGIGKLLKLMLSHTSYV
jgi:hypothetical protein